jgi:hypothetical protein
LLFKTRTGSGWLAWLAAALPLIALMACSDADEPREPVPPRSDVESQDSSSGAESSLLLPDLVTSVPAEVYVQYSLAGVKELRFSTLVENIGPGPLQIQGELNERETEAAATQVITTEHGNQEARFAGDLELDEAHGHWHLEKFALFELWPYQPGQTTPATLAGGSKITFCLMDQFPVEPGPVNAAPEPTFIECNWRMQGISPGWSEIYDATLPGQSLDIDGLPDGLYTFRATIDPDNNLFESDEDNNAISVVLDIRGDEVEIVASP